ncbi:MAG: M15 family metallopeptidase [Phycisphaerales bacterium]|nr:MAG: M15 family metallopeptidase [Phycisphaerales bacterium]
MSTADQSCFMFLLAGRLPRYGLGVLACLDLLAAAIVLPAVAAGCSQVRPEAGQAVCADEPLVDLADVAPRIVLDLRYATADNFLRQKLYPVARCLLRESVADRLRRVQDDLEVKGLGLKVFDGYRPLSVQRRMWGVFPDPKYVADPARGSRHNRGAAVDVTLVDAKGRELPMPSAFDEFSERAHRNYAGGTAEQRRNRRVLEDAMERHGFSGLDSEWWHFDAPGWQHYTILDQPLERGVSR